MVIASDRIRIKKFCNPIPPSITSLYRHTQFLVLKMALIINFPASHALHHKAKQFWDDSPQPVKSFPWFRAFETFIQLIFNLILAVIKYLSVPVFAVSCISELSYCAHERKLYFTPVPFLVGAAITGVLRAAAEETSPSLKNAAVPWHLIAIAIFFTLLKLPGPYYPYWGRLFIPHFENGSLFRTLWFALLWYRRPQKLSETIVAASMGANTQENL